MSHLLLRATARRFAAATVVLATALTLGATTYEVGPGAPLPALADVPWARLTPGDSVLVRWRAEPYRERVLLNARGRPDAPIRLQGVPGPNGALPVIDGQDATIAPGIAGLESGRSIVQVGVGDPEPDERPAHLEIVGLEIRGGRSTHQFRDAAGASHPYSSFAAALYVKRATHLTVRQCRLLDSGNGLLVASSDRSASSHILIEGCEIAGNGNPGSTQEHNSYTAAQGMEFRGNYLGPLLPGARGNNLKDRSSGLIVTHNWIEGGNRQLDLVNGEDSRHIRRDPAYHEAHVYNNVLLELGNDGNPQVVHYGGDTGAAADYRGGTLHFWHNTVVSWRTDGTVLFKLSTDAERVDLRNNLFHRGAATGRLSLVDEAGDVDAGVNWISAGWKPRMAGDQPARWHTGTLHIGADPGFSKDPRASLTLAPGSPCLQAAAPLPPEALARFAPASFHPKVRERVSCTPRDLGAFAIR